MGKKWAGNAKEGIQGFQKTIKHVDVPTTGQQNKVGFWEKRKDNSQRRRNTSNLQKVSQKFGFTIASYDGKGWVNSNQGGPGYRTVSPEQDKLLHTALNLDKAASEYGENLSGKELEKFTEHVSSQRQKLLTLAESFRWPAPKSSAKISTDSFEYQLKELQKEVDNIRARQPYRTREENSVDAMYARAQTLLGDYNFPRGRNNPYNPEQTL